MNFVPTLALFFSAIIASFALAQIVRVFIEADKKASTSERGNDEITNTYMITSLFG